MDPLTLSGLAFTGLTVASLIGLHAGKVVVPRLGRWEQPPRVIITSRSPVSRAEVDAAVVVLEQLGAQVAGVESGDPLSESVNGAIVIRWRAHHVAPEHAGVTRLQIEDGRIIWAVIYLPRLDVRPDPTAPGGFLEYSNEERAVLLAHELGHALGWDHTHTAMLGHGKHGRPRLGLVGRKTGHLMNPILQRMGWNTRGMEEG